MDREVLQVVEYIRVNNFKEKIKITKEFDGKARVEIIDNNFIYTDRTEVTY